MSPVTPVRAARDKDVHRIQTPAATALTEPLQDAPRGRRRHIVTADARYRRAIAADG